MPFDNTSAVQLAALRSELFTDPVPLGYGTFAQTPNAPGQWVGTKTDEELEKLLNAARADQPGYKRADITPAELLEAMDPRDIPATITNMPNNVMVGAWLESVCQAPKIRLATDAGTNTLMRQTLNRILGNANGSQTRLDALAVRQGSRAEALFGKDTVLSSVDVRNALGRG